MTASLSSPADLVNDALVRIGAKKQVGNLYDGSAAAQLSLSIYGQTRDDLLRSQDWGFAERNIALSLLKSAPTVPGGYGYIPPTTWNETSYPPIGWFFEYGYPGDCLKVRAVKPTPLFIPNFDPQPNTFTNSNDNTYTPGRRVILTNVPDALLVYTGRVTDPTVWAVDFTEALSEALGQRLAAGLASLDATKLEAAEAASGAAKAAMEQG